MKNLINKVRHHGKRITIYLKSQPKWVVRCMFGIGAILGLVLSLHTHPIGGTNAQSIECPEGQYLATGDVCITNEKDIVLQATATESDQTLTINKYFANDYTVDRGDGSPIESVTTEIIHTYSEVGTYNIILSLTGGATRRSFTSRITLVPQSGTTMDGVIISYMPSLADGFGISETNPGDYFFYCFNTRGAITSLPEGSFDMSRITTAGNNFFYGFNNNGSLTNLPVGSFNINTITTIGDYFFDSFNENGKLTSLPTGAFDTSSITTVGNGFFYFFNRNGALISLPEGSFRLSTGLTTVGDYFFYLFNESGMLTSLPDGSFDTSNITTAGRFFFGYFNDNGALTSLPEGSFRLSTGLTTVEDYFFAYFNEDGALTNLPEGSFDTSNITSVGNLFFLDFNHNGALTSLPERSFDISNITTAGDYFFGDFNNSGALTSLPEGSFDTSNITSVGDNFFFLFNNNGALTSLPEGSFDTSNITTAGDYFFYGFNHNGALTSLPEGSFDTSNITSVGDNFFRNFNNNGLLTSLPDSFKLNSVGSQSVSGYQSAFMSSFTLNKNVSDLVSGVTAPLDDRNVFSDNQPGRCGVDSNWLAEQYNACSITYNSNGGSEIANHTKKYEANTTGIVAGDGIETPTRTGYAFSGWYTAEQGGDLVDTVVFPNMDGGTLYAQWIDTTPPNCDVAYSTTGPTNQNVIATLTCEEDDITVTNNGGSDTYTFTNNGTFTFNYKDSANNEGSTQAVVTWIDTTPPACGTWTYNPAQASGATNQNVTATLARSDTGVGPISSSSQCTISTNNNSCTVSISDTLGNSRSCTSEIVTWIDKTSPILTEVTPVPTITNDTTPDYTFNSTEPGHITYGGSCSSATMNATTENNTITFNTLAPGYYDDCTIMVTDAAGNNSNVLPVSPFEIRTNGIVCTVSYAPAQASGWTSGNVVATLNCPETVTITNNGGSDTYTFTNNGTFTFNYKDSANNEGSTQAVVTWIDTTPPNCDVAYSTTGPTNQDVIATLTGCSEPVTVTNNDDSMEYTFENIGTFTFEFQDLAGNTGTELAAVTWIDKDIPSCDVAYSTTGATTGNVTATLTCEEEEDGDITVTNNSGNMEYTFENTGTFTFEFQDLAGNTGSADAVVTWINKTKPTCDVIYSTTGATTGNVTATLTGCSGTITGTNLQHTFTGNVTYTFNFQDLLGNTGNAVAEVTWIVTYPDIEGNQFRWNDLTICNPNKSGECITMMDRNLGATTNDVSKTGSYGYKYQWGNNYGFKDGCWIATGCSDDITSGSLELMTNGVEWENIYNNSGYYGNIFIKGGLNGYWSDWKTHNQLWGGGNDGRLNNWGYPVINPEDRQGPCPEGYHVPSVGERSKIIGRWIEQSKTGLREQGFKTEVLTGLLNHIGDNSGAYAFRIDFNIPKAGIRDWNNGTLGFGEYLLWTSTSDGQPYFYSFGSVHAEKYYSSSSGIPIRCFKNSYETGNTFSISIDEVIKPGEYATFTVTAIKDGQQFHDYTGTILFILTNKSGGLVNKKNYTLSNSGRYTFELNDGGKKIFYSGLKINEAGTYTLEVNGLKDGIKGSTVITVGVSHKSAEFKYDTLKFNPNYSDEMNQAYQYARYFDITTKNSIKDADMYSGLNRIAMAKMLTNYAENVLGKDNFNTGRNCSFSDVSNSLDKDYDYGVTKACQLGIMGVNMPDNRFYPNGGVTRAEFATALSRLLYNTKDGTERYYSTHITKLRREGIITNTDPALWELRGYVMLMLKRVAENNDE